MSRTFAYKKVKESPFKKKIPISEVPLLTNTKLTLIVLGILIPSGKGKHPLLMYKNYTYTYKVMSSTGVLWHCSRRTRTGCKAFIKSLPYKLDAIISVFDEHCHDARSGKVLWYCSRRANGCKASVLSENEQIKEKKGEHCHLPPVFMKNEDGTWKKHHGYAAK